MAVRKLVLVSFLASPVAAFVVRQQSNVQVSRMAAPHQQGPNANMNAKRRLLLAMSEDPYLENAAENAAENPSGMPPPFSAKTVTPESDVDAEVVDASPDSTSFDFQEVIANLNLASLEKFVDISSLTENADKILANVKEGEFGKRGEVYVAAQFGLLFCVLIGGVPFFGDLLKFLLGPELFVVGIAAIFLGAKDLGGALTPFPVPVESSEEGLVSDGIFGQVRHPMYAGVLASCAGFSILTGSATRLLLTALLIYVLGVKSDFEEEGLVQKYPEYAAYMKEVEGKFFPQKLLNDLPWGNKE
jgi:protein-S-isoprenylcysteine O-methyltransferase Ste14